MTRNERLIETIKEDCEYFYKLVNHDKMFSSWMTLDACSDSKETGLYVLDFNGRELWYGTLPEINAVVKSMIKRYEIEQED